MAAVASHSASRISYRNSLGFDEPFGTSGLLSELFLSQMIISYPGKGKNHSIEFSLSNTILSITAGKSLYEGNTCFTLHRNGCR